MANLSRVPGRPQYKKKEDSPAAADGNATSGQPTDDEIPDSEEDEEEVFGYQPGFGGFFNWNRVYE